MLLARACSPWPEWRVLHRDDGLVVVDKPPGLPVEGAADDVVTRLGAWLEQRGTPADLRVLAGLAGDASGVMALALGGERARSIVADQDVERRFLAVVEGRVPDQSTLRERVDLDHDGACRVVQRGGRVVHTRLRTVRRVGRRTLLDVSATAASGDALRAVLAHREAPLSGDARHGGEWAPRLMLHASEVRMPSVGTARFEAPAPEALVDWLECGALRLGSETRVHRALQDAGARRWGLERATTALRLVDDVADDLPGISVESYGRHCVVFARSEEARARTRTVAEALVALGADGVYEKIQMRGDRRRTDAGSAAPPDPIAGTAAPEPLVVREGPLAFRVHLAEGHHTGLFLDQRDNRALIRQMASGRSMLNLFCYTGSFTVAAGVGGARTSMSVDLSKRVLGRLLENLEQNGLDPQLHKRVAGDVLPWLARAARKGHRFDLVVLDPPSFGTRGKRTFSVARDYGTLAVDALRVVAPGGSLLAVTNHQGTSPERFRRMLGDAARAAEREVVRVQTLAMPRDFPNRPEGRVPTKSVLVTLA